jgi:hypothetical protein
MTFPKWLTMAILSLTFMKRALVLAGIFCSLLAATPKALASAEDQIDNGLAASKTWVALIDAGEYDDSYTFGCDAMHDKVPQDRWGIVLKALRAPWGPVVNRSQVSHVYKPNGYEGAEGEFMVITYDTSFQKMDQAIEVVVLKWEDGKWRGAGYNAGPKPSPDDDSASPPPSSSTETQTETHVRPQSQ